MTMSPANHLHILAEGDTHLPYAQPRFGTPCAANRQALLRGGQMPATAMMGDDGMMDMVEVEPLATRRATETERATVGVVGT